MNDLLTLLKLRRTTIRQIALEMGAEYSSLQKTAKGRRKHPGMQEILAAYFGVNKKLLFGKRRSATIRYLMEREIDKQGERLREQLRKRYLGAA